MSTPVFTVQARDGQTRIYKSYAPAGAPATHWLLDRVTDADGNSVAYSYRTDLASSSVPGLAAQVYVWEYPIASITYTGRVSASGVAQGERQVVFNYGSGGPGVAVNGQRPDPVAIRYGGATTTPCTGCVAPASAAEVRNSQLLQSIDVFAPMPIAGTTSTAPAKVWTYTLGYVASAGTGRALLSSIDKSSAASTGGRTLSRQFTYDERSGVNWTTDWSTTPLQVALPNNGNAWPQYSGFYPANATWYVDLNNDGLADIVTTSGSCTLAAATPATNASINLAGLNPYCGSLAAIVDINGDGFPEIVMTPSTGRYDVFSRQGSSYALMAHLQAPAVGNGSAIFFTDLDGQGLPSAVVASTSTDSGFDNFSSPLGTDYVDQPGLLGAWLFPNANGTLGSPIPLFSANGIPVGSPASDPTVQTTIGSLGPILSPSYEHNASVGDGSGAGVNFGWTAATLTNAQTYGELQLFPWVGLGGAYASLWDVTSGVADVPSQYGAIAWTSTGRILTLRGGAPFFYVSTEPWTAGPLPQTLLGSFDGVAGAETYGLNLTDLASIPNVDTNPAHWGIAKMDLNGDGRDDVIAMHQWPNNCAGCFGVDAAYMLSWRSAGNMSAPLALPSVPVAMADFDGDGRPDLVTVPFQSSSHPPGSGSLLLHTRTAGDVLTLVSDENVASPLEQVSYTQQWGSSGSAQAPGFLQNASNTSCIWPEHCVESGMRVVASRSVFQGAEVGAYDVHYYTYSGPRSDMRGRGFLGFSSVVDFDPTRPSETVTAYDNVTSPADGMYLASLPKTVTVTIPTNSIQANGGTAAPVHQTVTSYVYHTLQTHPSTYAVQLSGWTSVETEGVATINWAAQALPAHFTLPTAPAVGDPAAGFVYDAYGNLTSDVEATSASPVSVFGASVLGTVTGVQSVTTISPAPYLLPPSSPMYLVSRPATITTWVWTPSTQAAATVQPRTVDYVYDPAHPALPQTVVIDELSSDPTAPLTTTLTRSRDGVPVAVNVSAFDPVLGGTAVRTTSIVLDPDEGIFPRQVTQQSGTVALTTQVLMHPVYGAAVDTIDPNGIATVVVLDDLGRAQQTTIGPNPTLFTTYAQRLDSSGHVIGGTITRSGAGVVASALQTDLLGRPVVSQMTGFDGNQECSTASYDVLGRVTFVSRPAEGTPTACPTPSTSGTAYQYDDLNRVVSAVRPDRGTYSYSQLFLPTTTSDPMGHVRSVTRDLDGRTVLSTQTLSSANQALTTSYQYGAFNQVSQINAPGGNTITLTYDQRGRRTQIVDADAGRTNDTYNGFGEIVTESRNGLGCSQLVSSGTEYCLVALQATSSTASVGTSVTLTADVSADVGPSPYYVAIQDETGHVVANCGSGTICSASVSSSTNATHTYSVYLTAYPSMGGVTDSSATLANSVTVTWGTGTSGYDPPAFRSTSYVHDGLGRVTQKTNSEDGTTTFAWDASPNGLGALAWATSPDNVTINYGYDAWSRPTTTTWTTPTASGGANESFSFNLGYDSLGRASSFAYPEVQGSFSVQRSFDPTTGHFTSVSSLNPMISGAAPVWAVQGRAPDGQLTQGQLGNGLVETRTYDAVGRPWTIVDVPQGSSTSVRSLTYQYDGDGAVSSKTDNVRGLIDAYGHDSLHRIAWWERMTTGAAQGLYNGYAYDSQGLGNITSVSGSTWNGSSYTTLPQEIDSYASTRPHALTTTNNGTIGAYSYDDRGRQTSSPTRSSVTYTSFDLPRSVTAGDGTTTFLYDAFGRRVNKRNASAGTATLTLGGQFERRTTPTSVTNVFFIQGSDGVVVQAEWTVTTLITQTYTVEYLLADAQGSTNVVTNASGQVVFRLDYDPFGRRTAPLGGAFSNPGGAGSPGDVNVGYAGLNSDDNVGLVNMNGRLYDPAARHFLSPDPLVGRPFDARSYNRYGYALNDPANMTDRSGYDPDDGEDNDGGDDSGGYCGGGSQTPNPPPGGTGGAPASGPPNVANDPVRVYEPVLPAGPRVVATPGTSFGSGQVYESPAVSSGFPGNQADCYACVSNVISGVAPVAVRDSAGGRSSAADFLAGASSQLGILGANALTWDPSTGMPYYDTDPDLQRIFANDIARNEAAIPNNAAGRWGARAVSIGVFAAGAASVYAGARLSGSSTESESGRFTFRADGRGPDKIFDPTETSSTNGFQLFPDAHYVDYAEYVARNQHSGYVSTTFSGGVAHGWVAQRGGWVYVVDNAGLVTLDANQSVGFVKFGPGPLDHACLQFESTVLGPVPLSNVVGGQQVLPGGALGPYVPNPYYDNR